MQTLLGKTLYEESLLPAGITRDTSRYWTWPK